MKNGHKHPMQYLLKQKAAMMKKVAVASNEMDHEAGKLRQAEKAASFQNESAISLEDNLMKGQNPLAPGNVGDINRIIWPFWFTTTELELQPNESQDANFTVTQEAAFVWTSYTKAVFVEVQNGDFRHVDPEEPGSGAKANNLSFVIQDSQSQRAFQNIGMDLNQLGWWQKPSVLPTPVLFLPNSNIDVTFQNNDANDVYKPFITFFGYRLRIDHAKDILSTIYG